MYLILNLIYIASLTTHIKVVFDYINCPNEVNPYQKLRHPVMAGYSYIIIIVFFLFLYYFTHRTHPCAYNKAPGVNGTSKGR